MRVLSNWGMQAFCWKLLKFISFSFMPFVVLFSVPYVHIMCFPTYGSCLPNPNGLFLWVILTCGRETSGFELCFWSLVFLSPMWFLRLLAFMTFHPCLLWQFFPFVACWCNCILLFHLWDQPYPKFKSLQFLSWTW